MTSTQAISRVSFDGPCSDEAALVTAAKAGEEQAFTELLIRHRKRILTIVQRITRNHADSEDVFQVTCMQAFVHICRFDGRSKFSTWLTRIAINSALMSLRRNRVANATSISDLVEGDSSWLRDPKVDVWAEIQERERAWHLENAIGQLQPCLRTAMQLQRQHEGSVKRTAELSGLSDQAVKSRLFRARRELRRQLEACV